MNGLTSCICEKILRAQQQQQNSTIRRVFSTDQSNVSWEIGTKGWMCPGEELLSTAHGDGMCPEDKPSTAAIKATLGEQKQGT